MNKPKIFRGPASHYAEPNEVIMEFGVGGTHDEHAPGGLISIMETGDGTLRVDLYRMNGKVRVLNAESQARALHARIKALAADNGGDWPGADVVDILSEWFDENGYRFDDND